MAISIANAVEHVELRHVCRDETHCRFVLPLASSKRNKEIRHHEPASLVPGTLASHSHSNRDNHDRDDLDKRLSSNRNHYRTEESTSRAVCNHESQIVIIIGLLPIPASPFGPTRYHLKAPSSPDMKRNYFDKILMLDEVRLICMTRLRVKHVDTPTVSD
jgi:hypothetical protein